LTEKNKLKDYAYSQGAQLLTVRGIGPYVNYLEQVRNRLAETRAGYADFMNPPVANRNVSEDLSFFSQISDPRTTLPGAQSVILIGVYGYDQVADYSRTKKELKGKTARIYPYYPVVRQIAEAMVSWLKQHGYASIHGQHIPLKHVANESGMGIYGKNGILQTPEFGSFIALRCILTEANFPPDQHKKLSSPCDACDKCIRACPTGAIYAPYKVNPRLCLNPISRREKHIEPHLRNKMQNWMVGCDICQEVCPSNKALEVRDADPRACFDSRFHASHRNLDGMDRRPELLPLLSQEQPQLIRRNAAIALGNTAKGHKEVIEALQQEIPGAPEKLRGYFQWALDKITSATKN
jgi:epoxyqueuosine reductase